MRLVEPRGSFVSIDEQRLACVYAARGGKGPAVLNADLDLSQLIVLSHSYIKRSMRTRQRVGEQQAVVVRDAQLHIQERTQCTRHVRGQHGLRRPEMT